MIDIDLVNVDFDLSKDKEHTTKYLNDLNNQTPFSVLDNTYTEHLRAVLNYSPILKIREPFKGCKPVTVADTYVGTYIGFDAEYNTYPLDVINSTGNTDLGKYTDSENKEDYMNFTHAKYIFSTTKTDTEKIRHLQYTADEYFSGTLVTDFSKNGSVLTLEQLAQGVEARFLLPTENTFSTIYTQPLVISNSSYGRTAVFSFPETGLYSDELHLYYTHISINGHLISNESDIDLLGISGLRVEVARGISHLKTNTPVLLNIDVHDGVFLNNALYSTQAQGDNIFSSLSPSYKLYLLPS